MKRFISVAILLLIIVSIVGYGGFQYYKSSTGGKEVKPVNYQSNTIKTAEELFDAMQKASDKYKTAKYNVTTTINEETGGKEKSEKFKVFQKKDKIRVEYQNSNILGCDGNNIWMYFSGSNDYFTTEIEEIKQEVTEPIEQPNNNLHMYRKFYNEADSTFLDNNNNQYILEMAKEDGEIYELYVNRDYLIIESEKHYLPNGRIIETDINNLELGIDVDDTEFTPPNDATEKKDKEYAILGTIAKGLKESGQYENAIKMFDLALEYAPFEEGPKLESEFYIDKGDCYGFLEMFEKAAKNFKKASEVEGINSKTKAYALTSQGMMLYDLDKKEKALRSFEKSVEISTKHIVSADAYGYIGKIYSENENYEKSLEAYKNALELAESEDDKEFYRDCINYVEEEM